MNPSTTTAKEAIEQGGFSLESYLADPHTRVFNYNGRKLFSIFRGDGFRGQRMCILPAKTLEFASRQSLTSALLPGRVGYFPHAAGQKVLRPNGDWAFVVLYCMDGVGTVDTATNRHVVGAGTFVLLRPFEFHSYAADPGKPWSYYWVHFHGTAAQQYYDVITDCGRNIVIASGPDVSFVENFQRILHLLEDGPVHRNLVCASSSMHQLLGDIYRRTDSDAPEQRTLDARVARCIAAMRNNVNLRFSIREMAAAANMSHSYFIQNFKRCTSNSPRSYFNRLKIEKACEYLRNTDGTVDSIAHLLGFEDAFYFRRLFKRVVGQTPTSYRRDRSAPVDLFKEPLKNAVR